jgi:threonine dehydrogenase-like Zn-dependent dehydrogenase
MSTGVIEAVGEGVEDLHVGDKVYTRGNNTNDMHLLDGTKVSCTSGAHASHVVAKMPSSHGVAKLPDGVGMDVASMFVMPAVGLFGVDMANPRMGDTVVVYGSGLIGLGVIAACAHRGCKVIAVDIFDKQLELAKQMGAEVLINGSWQDVQAEVKELTQQGADVVFEATGIPECINPAIALCKPFGKFVWQGNYGTAPVNLNFLSPHGKRLQMYFPCDDGLQSCRRAVLKNMGSGALKWEKTITHRIGCSEAPGMFDAINNGDDKTIIGVVISWK